MRTLPRGGNAACAFLWKEHFQSGFKDPNTRHTKSGRFQQNGIFDDKLIVLKLGYKIAVDDGRKQKARNKKQTQKSLK